MISAVVSGAETLGVGRVAGDLVEVDDGVEAAGGADPGVDGLAVGFAGGVGMVVIGAGEGQNGGANDADAGGVGAKDNLLVCGGDVLHECGVLGGRRGFRPGESTDVVDAFENDNGANSGLGENVAIEAGERIGA